MKNEKRHPIRSSEINLGKWMDFIFAEEEREWKPLSEAEQYRRVAGMLLECFGDEQTELDRCIPVKALAIAL